MRFVPSLCLQRVSAAWAALTPRIGGPTQGVSGGRGRQGKKGRDGKAIVFGVRDEIFGIASRWTRRTGSGLGIACVYDPAHTSIATLLPSSTAKYFKVTRYQMIASRLFPHPSAISLFRRGVSVVNCLRCGWETSTAPRFPRFRESTE